MEQRFDKVLSEASKRVEEWPEWRKSGDVEDERTHTRKKKKKHQRGITIRSKLLAAS